MCVYKLWGWFRSRVELIPPATDSVLGPTDSRLVVPTGPLQCDRIRFGRMLPFFNGSSWYGCNTSSHWEKEGAVHHCTPWQAPQGACHKSRDQQGGPRAPSGGCAPKRALLGAPKHAFWNGFHVGQAGIGTMSKTVHRNLKGRKAHPWDCRPASD